MGTISVILADDHVLVRTSIRHFIEETEDIKVVAEAGTGEEAIALAKQKKPDMVIMDLNMPGIGGLEATCKLQSKLPDVKVVVLTMHVEDPFPAQLMRAGASGYITKGSPANEMIEAIRKVHAGERFVSVDVARNLALSLLSEKNQSPFHGLSAREMQVVTLILEGTSIQGVSDALSLSPKTVSTYKYRIYAKLGVDNDVEMTRLAMRYSMLGDQDTPPGAG